MRFLFKLLGPGGLAALLLMVATVGVFAQESTTIIQETAVADTAAPAIDTGDTAWMLTSTALVLADDHPRRRAVLRRHGPQEERARRRHAELRRVLSRHGSMDGPRL